MYTTFNFSPLCSVYNSAQLTVLLFSHVLSSAVDTNSNILQNVPLKSSGWGKKGKKRCCSYPVLAKRILNDFCSIKQLLMFILYSYHRMKEQLQRSFGLTARALYLLRSCGQSHNVEHFETLLAFHTVLPQMVNPLFRKLGHE